MNAVTFHVPGKPQGKARAKTVRNKHTGNTMSYTPETDLLYENYIKEQFINDLQTIRRSSGVKYWKDLQTIRNINNSGKMILYR